ncbi:MAG: hypothetical protein ABL940_03900, partial [Bacteroidia bacterium]
MKLKRTFTTTLRTNTPAKLLVLCCITLATSCSYFGKSNERILATVGKNDLTLTEMQAILPNNTKGNDSVEFVKSYVQAWVQEQLIVQKAINNLSSNELNVDEQIEKYKNSLIVYAYQQALVKQKLDTVVTPQEIEAYYNAHEQDFELKDNII